MLQDIIDRGFHGSVSVAIDTLLELNELDGEERQLLRDVIRRKLEATAVTA